MEGFAGPGRLWRSCWLGFRGLTIDLDLDKATKAAEERPGWTVYCGDTLKCLAEGIGASTRFDVVDLDCFGSPWSFLEAWMKSKRLRAPETYIVLTDGYMSRRSLSSPCKALFPDVEKGQRVSTTVDLYLSTAQDRIDEWASNAGLEALWVSSDGGVKGGTMATHVIKVRTAGA